MMRTIALVSCGGPKVAERARARNLYTGSLFRDARAWAMKHADDWRILSAKWGLVDPDEFLDPYDLSMDDLDRNDREVWGRHVRAELRKEGLWNDRLVLFAGVKYESAVEGAPNVEKPLAGLGTGYRRHWFKENT
jgi:cytoplasmic iron level regulating protein YaaA (DUF328/UPF0246 family)